MEKLPQDFRSFLKLLSEHDARHPIKSSVSVTNSDSLIIGPTPSRQRNVAPKGGRQLSTHPVQLYDTVADIGETTNLAAKYPEVAKRLQAAYAAHLADINATRRPTAKLIRREGAPSPEPPGGARKKKAKKKKK
jgi:hypothetical protein